MNLTETEAGKLLWTHGAEISRRLNLRADEAREHYVGENAEGATVGVHAYGAWEISQQDVDEDGAVVVAELRDGDATSCLTINLATGEIGERFA